MRSCCNCTCSIDDVLTHYFHRGYPHDAIVGLLKCVYGHFKKRRLKSLGLRRQGNGKLIYDSKLREAIREEMNTPGRSIFGTLLILVL